MDVLPRIAYVDGPRLRDDAANLPTTSQPSRADFLRTFEQAGEDGERIVGVLLGSTLSGTFASAEAVGCPPIVQPVTEALRRRYGPGVEILSAPATPVISTHLGAGAWGVAYLVEDDDELPGAGKLRVRKAVGGGPVEGPGPGRNRRDDGTRLHPQDLREAGAGRPSLRRPHQGVAAPR